MVNQKEAPCMIESDVLSITYMEVFDVFLGQ